MPVAIISDIHGNLLALDAVLNDIEDHNIKQIICLGDIAATGPQPREVIARLKQIGCPVVMGNMDDWLLEPKLKERDDPAKQRTQDMEFWASQQLTSEDHAYLASFPLTLSYELEDGKHLLAYHGSPRSYKEHIAPTMQDHDLEAALAGYQADIFIGGHTHMQMFRCHRRSLVLNPGSTGLAFDHAWPFDDTVRNPPWQNTPSSTLSMVDSTSSCTVCLLTCKPSPQSRLLAVCHMPNGLLENGLPGEGKNKRK